MQAPEFQYLLVRDKSFLVINLFCNFSGAVALFFRRRAGVYLLIVGFLVGALGEAWPIVESYRDGFALHVPVTVISFVFPLAIILYGASLTKRGVLV